MLDMRIGDDSSSLMRVDAATVSQGKSPRYCALHWKLCSAIIQSGPKLRTLSTRAAASTTRALLEDLDLADNPEGLLSVSPEALIDAQVRVLGGPLGFGPLTFGPVVDGVDLPHHPFDPVRSRHLRRRSRSDRNHEG